MATEASNETRYRDPEWLYTQYHPDAEDKAASEIAAECGVSAETIRRWIKRHDDLELKGRQSNGEAKQHKNVPLSPEVWDRHRERKQELGVTWDEYLDTVAPEWADVVGEAVADELDDETDVREAVEDVLEGTGVDAVREAAYQGAREAVQEMQQGGMR